MFALLTLLAAGASTVLGASIPTTRQIEHDCALNPLVITNFTTVDNSASLHSVEFNFSVTNNVENGYSLTAKCALSGSSMDAIKEATGECDATGAAFFRYNPYERVLSVAVDYLCSASEG